MLPKMPPRSGQVGFVYVPPYRVQGVSVAGEQTVVQVPELDVAFDIGMCPRVALASPYVALSHGHMDHVGGLPYYFSQRMFQRMGPGTCVCHAALEQPLTAMMQSWIDLEQQRTQHRIVGLEPDQEIEIKNNIFLRAIAVSHTVPALGYAVIERRSKLREEFAGLPQDKLRELKSQGTEITRILEIPLVAYTGDTELGPFLYRDEFVKAKIVISECTFFEPDHRSRASVGKHLHADDIAALLNVWQADAVVLVHFSRRTNMLQAREHLAETVGAETMERVHVLMDHRTNRLRYEQQLAEVPEQTTC
ncbi:MAG: MBL fold metallo-hydrolase [Planctomycetes bacterium]|nr:MBL fold metallo-hydrolase [Planctomycetota bacterium]